MPPSPENNLLPPIDITELPEDWILLLQVKLADYIDRGTGAAGNKSYYRLMLLNALLANKRLNYDYANELKETQAKIFNPDEFFTAYVLISLYTRNRPFLESRIQAHRLQPA
ncbi:MAG: hypothetical protein COY81_04445 [Candidatus Pacebacteria bacterium CG_4_10_14_0_8_um_filter_43_12]|nr:MAG: hypothetical protein COY81_04445 [Candidatus Pacebacteria bacterium CG_4_10_14_0_8_um_filter_43_12]